MPLSTPSHLPPHAYTRFASKLRKADNDRLKPKAGELPADVKYYAAQETPDVWLAYPWECETSIEEHDADRVKNFVP